MLRVSTDSGLQGYNSNVSVLTHPLSAHILYKIYYSVYDDFVYQLASF